MIQGVHLNEISVIGSLLISPETIEVISAQLKPSDFESDSCRAIYEAALELESDGIEVDAVLLAGKVRSTTGKSLDGFIMDCMECTPTAANIKLYCEEVKRESNLRKLSDIALQLNDSVYTAADWRQVVSDTTEALAEIDDDDNGVVCTSADAVSEWQEYYYKVSANPGCAYCSTGYKTLDEKLGGGMVRSGLYIIGARPGMGKTTLGVNIAENVARSGKPVLFISMEMSKKQVTAKRIAKLSGVNYTKLINGGMDESECLRASEAASEIYDRPFYISDSSKTTVVDITRAVRSVKDVALVVVDYLGLIRSDNPQSNKPRYEEMTDISADLKAMAKKLDIPVAVLCQLNRENNTGADKRPKLHHLRDTGAIEQDADGVILLHRPEYYKDKTADDYAPPEYEDFEVDVAKNRHGETGVVKMLWHGSTGNIREIDFSLPENKLPFGGKNS